MTHRTKWEKRAAWLVLLSLPLLQLIVILTVTRVELGTFVPNYPNDEVSYYLQARAFGAQGLNAGLFIVDEQRAQATWSHYGPHGLMFPIVYSLPGLFQEDWPPVMGIWLHIVYLTAAMAVYVGLVQPTWTQTLSIGVVYLTFIPLVQFLVSFMQEPFHHAVAIVFAAILLYLGRVRADVSWWGMAAIIAFGLVASLTRYTWSMLFFPILLLTLRRWTLPRVALRVMLSGGLMLLCYLAFSYMGAPYPLGHLEAVFAAAAAADPRLFTLIWQHTLDNLVVLWDGAATRFMGLQFVAMFGVIGILALYERQWGRALTLAVVVIPIFVLMLTLYHAGLQPGYRSISVHLFAGLLLLIGWGRLRYALPIALLPLVAYPAIHSDFGNQLNVNRWRAAPEVVATFEAEIGPHLLFDETTDNPWCNTLSSAWALFDGTLVALPPGYGLSVITTADTLMNPMQSRYILLLPEHTQYITSQTSWRLVAETTHGLLYHNDDAACGASPG